MTELQTVFSSNIPIDCHIIKGRLETDGIDCYIFDEIIVWTDPFYAVAIGGVKLMVRENQMDAAKRIIYLVNQQKLMDEDGEYELDDALENDINKENEILEIKGRIRNDPSLLEKPEAIITTWLTVKEKAILLDSEKEFQIESNQKLKFTWEQFWFELFDFDQSVFKYLWVHPVEYYLDKELVENYFKPQENDSGFTCPNCGSQNVSYGQSIDYHWDIIYLFLSVLFLSPMPMVRNNCHCFHCGYNFNKWMALAGYRKSADDYTE